MNSSRGPIALPVRMLAARSKIRPLAANNPIKLAALCRRALFPTENFMRIQTWTAAAAAVALMVAGLAPADDAAKIVAEAIKAHGGAEKLNANKDKNVIQKGKMKLFQPIEAEGPYETSLADGNFRRSSTSRSWARTSKTSSSSTVRPCG